MASTNQQGQQGQQNQKAQQAQQGQKAQKQGGTEMQRQAGAQAAQGAQAGQVERMQARRSVAPPVDILEGPDETWLVADLPGVKKEDLEIELQHNELRLRAHAGERFDEEPFDYVRSFRLPPGIEGDKVSADLRDGVLTLKLPKPAELKPRKIDVRVG